jgi:hypothetical protein
MTDTTRTKPNETNGEHPSPQPANPANPARPNARCRLCQSNGVGKKRAAYGHTICKVCAEKRAVQERLSWCVAPMHKSNYMLITNRADLVGLNNKGGLVK